MTERSVPKKPDTRQPEGAIDRAFREVPRGLFMHQKLRDFAHIDSGFPIGFGQTISQPSMVRTMTECAGLQGHERVLEIGTGSGYQAAILSRLTREVFTIERIPELARGASDVLAGLGYANVHSIIGDGSVGLPEHAPYDVIMVTAHMPEVYSDLVAQLKDGGRMVAPIGGEEDTCHLFVLEKQGNGVRGHNMGPVYFVPLEGERGWPIGETQVRYKKKILGFARAHGISFQEAQDELATQFGVTPQEAFGDLGI